MSYEIGDRVKIKTWKEMEKEFGISSISCICAGYYGFVKDMEEWINKKFTNRILTIEEVLTNSYLMNGDRQRYHWDNKMIKYRIKEEEIFKPITSRFEILDL